MDDKEILTGIKNRNLQWNHANIERVKELSRSDIALVEYVTRLHCGFWRLTESGHKFLNTQSQPGKS